MGKVPEYTKRAMKAYVKRKQEEVRLRRLNGEKVHCVGGGEKQLKYVKRYYEKNKVLINTKLRQKTAKKNCLKELIKCVQRV